MRTGLNWSVRYEESKHDDAIRITRKSCTQIITPMSLAEDLVTQCTRVIFGHFHSDQREKLR